MTSVDKLRVGLVKRGGDVHHGDNLDIFKPSSTFPDFSGNFQLEVSPKLPLQALQGIEYKALKVLNVTHT